MKVIAVIVSAILFIGAILLFINAGHMVGIEGYAFGAGVILMTLAFFLPIHVLRSHKD